MSDAGRLVPSDLVSPGVAAIYTGQTRPEPDDSTDADGHVIAKRTTWPWTRPGQERMWGDEVSFVRDAIERLNEMQTQLGPLDDDTRKIRYHIGSLFICDSGVPVTIDELLGAVGTGTLPEPSFHNGCTRSGWWWPTKVTQPHHVQSMRTIHDVLAGYLAGKAEQEQLDRFPHAKGFIHRTYEWFGPRDAFTRLQELMTERALLVFGFCTQTSMTWTKTDGSLWEATNAQLHDEGGRGQALDAQIAELAGLPKMHPVSLEEYTAALETITDESKRELYEICNAIGHGLHGSCDCHHSAFRWVENWVYAIGTRRWDIPTRKRGSERERLGTLLTSYALALDSWLVGVPMQFLLLDLGHLDLGFEPKNEVLRVYAHLGDDRTPTKQWLAACLWHNLYRGALTSRQMACTKELGLSARQWMSAAIGKNTEGQ